MTNIDQEKWLESNAFFCEYHRARITEKVCSGLQEQARKELEYVKPMKLSACWRCGKMEKRSNVQNVRDVRIVKKEEETMAKSKMGICANCGREISLTAWGLCNICYVASRGLTGEVREKALERARERIAAGKIRGKRLSPAPPREPSLGSRQVAEKIINRIGGSNSSNGLNSLNCSTRKTVTLAITFAGADINLYDALVARGRRERRDPEQQLMFILDHQLLEVHRGQEEG